MRISWSDRGLPCSRTVRMGFVGLAIGLSAGFLLASQLVPAVQGYGTHQQLGFPECGFRMLFRRPCPACGMTTCFAHFVRGEWWQAGRANPAGLVLAVVCGLLIPWAAISAGKGRWWLLNDPLPVVSSLAVGVLLITLFTWFFRLLA